MRVKQGTIWRCRRSENPLCSSVCGGVVRCEIPDVERKLARAMYSPPLSENKVLVDECDFL